MTSHIGRRKFLATLGGAAMWPLAAGGQQSKPPRIGFLGLAFERTAGEWLRAGLRDLGYIEGTNIIIEWQWAQNVDELPARRRKRAVEVLEGARSLSRMRCFGAVSHGNASVIWRANHSAVGLRVTANHSNRRRWCLRTRNANSC